ncbi:P27 family phage terminase small subunit [Xanthomonas perforans]|uniref:P27 family phage terminase small subunit n=1 Tax=Xanthomonas perforans TaxID=442694 RepID=UPI00115EFCA7|nr:P27 family phage terminase small subunit [Xanthomonas perforans]TQT50527.1 P27 family phage terminase small subunit [Xanthomonas perforans]
MRGRKPTAPALKVIAGTARPDREVPDVPEFDLIDDFPDAPQHLNADGAAMWRDLGPQLVAAKVLRVVDLYALQQLCYAWQRMVMKQKAGMDITAAEDTAFKALMSEFGMTPASRRKVSSGGDSKKPGNKFAALAAPGK